MMDGWTDGPVGQFWVTSVFLDSVENQSTRYRTIQRQRKCRLYTEKTRISKIGHQTQNLLALRQQEPKQLEWLALSF